MTQIAAQLYTVRAHAKNARDLAETLEKVRKIGYEAVQLSGVAAVDGEERDVPAAELKKMFDGLGIRCIATHRDWERLASHTSEEIDFQKTLDCDYAAIGAIPRDYWGLDADDYLRFLDQAKPTIQRLKEAGIRFGYHNHSIEYIRGPKGTCGIDALLGQGGPDVFMEIDTYWVANAGANPNTAIRRCKGRLHVMHLKDRMVVKINDTHMAPVGEGNLEWDDILAAARESGCRWYAVEQDQCLRDPFDCLKSSYNFLRSKGLT